MTKLTNQVVLIDQPTIHENQQVETMALFLQDGTPVRFSEGIFLPSYIARRTLTSEEVASLDTDVNYEIIPAPGPGKIISIQKEFAKSIPGTSVYSQGPEKICLRWGTDQDAREDFSSALDVLGVLTQRITDSIGNFSNLADIDKYVNQPLNISATGPIIYGAIVSAHVGDGGTGYVVNDTFEISGSSAGPSTATVTAVGVGGVVTAFDFVNGEGSSYKSGEHTAVTTSGVGEGLTVIIDEVETGDGGLEMIVTYQIIDEEV